MITRAKVPKLFETQAPLMGVKPFESPEFIKIT
jgi:hypothetical protein